MICCDWNLADMAQRMVIWDEGGSVSTGKRVQAVSEFKAPICAKWTEFRLLHIVMWLLSVCSRGETWLIVQFLTLVKLHLIWSCLWTFLFYFIWLYLGTELVSSKCMISDQFYWRTLPHHYAFYCHLLIQSSSWVGDAHSLKCGQLLPERRDSHSPLKPRVWL